MIYLAGTASGFHSNLDWEKSFLNSVFSIPNHQHGNFFSFSSIWFSCFDTVLRLVVRLNSTNCWLKSFNSVFYYLLWMLSWGEMYDAACLFLWFLHWLDLEWNQSVSRIDSWRKSFVWKEIMNDSNFFYFILKKFEFFYWK